MPESYKLHVKLGVNEFNAEGPEQQVRDDYERFLSALATVPTQRSVTATPETGAINLAGSAAVTVRAAGTLDAGPIARDRIEQVYASDRDRGIVSLRLLPSESTNREADAAILILYGFRVLLGQRDVLMTRLNESLRQSGLTIDRLDRFMGIYNNLVMRGGSRSGGRYTLNNVGVQTAENWLRTRYE